MTPIQTQCHLLPCPVPFKLGPPLTPPFISMAFSCHSKKLRFNCKLHHFTIHKLFQIFYLNAETNKQAKMSFDSAQKGISYFSKKAVWPSTFTPFLSFVSSFLMRKQCITFQTNPFVRLFSTGVPPRSCSGIHVVTIISAPPSSPLSRTPAYREELRDVLCRAQ